MEPSTKNDILASNLLFATLGLTVLLQVAGWVSQALMPHQTYFHTIHFSALALGGIAVYLLVRGALYYAVRRGFLAAKLLLALGFVVLLYTGTYWQQGVVAGINFIRFIMLVNGVLTLASLVLMFTKSREAVPSGT
jgi:lysylphosphatidylglycerol synthetase-like protein (DUF2156 family)